MTQTLLSPAQVDDLVGLQEAGATLVKAGEQLGVYCRTVAADMVRRSVPIHWHSLDEHRLGEAVELYSGGLALVEVVCSSETASRRSSARSLPQESPYSRGGEILR